MRIGSSVRRAQSSSICSVWAHKMIRSSAALRVVSGLALLCLFVVFFQPRPSSLVSARVAKSRQSSLNLSKRRVSSLGSSLTEGSELLQVHVVHRHGARTPLSMLYFGATRYSNCSNAYPGPLLTLKDEQGGSSTPQILDLGQALLPGGCRMGQLTAAGHEMGRALGEWLRSRYVLGGGATADAGVGKAAARGRKALKGDAVEGGGGITTSREHSIFHVPFLPGKFDATLIYLRATRIQRTVFTLQGLLLGLYPETASLSASQGGRKMSKPAPLSISVNVAATEQFEIEYGKNTTCAALQPLQDKVLRRLDKMDRTDPEILRLAAEVSLALELPLDPSGAPLNWIRLYDALAAMTAEGIPTPEGLTSNLRELITRQATEHESSVVSPHGNQGLSAGGGHKAMRFSEKVTRMSVGPLLSRIVAAMMRGRGDGGEGDQGAVNAARIEWNKEEEDSKRSRRRMLLVDKPDNALVEMGVGIFEHRNSKQKGRLDEDTLGTEKVGTLGTEKVGTFDHSPAADRGQTMQLPLSLLRLLPFSARKLLGSHWGEAGGRGGAHRKLGDNRDAATPRAPSAADNPSLQPRMFIYSGHDSTLTPILVALGRPASTWPPFTSSLVFELWRRPVLEEGAESLVRSENGGELARRTLMQSLGHLFSASLASEVAPSTSEQEVEETYPRRQLLFSKSQLEVRVLYNREPLDDLEGGHPGPGGWISLEAFSALLAPFSATDEANQAECRGAEQPQRQNHHR